MMKEKIFVFGMGKYYQKKKREIKNKFEVIGFFDSRISQGTTNQSEDGYNIYSPNDWSGVLEDAKILIAVLDWFPLYEQLLSEGVPYNRIIFSVVLSPAYDECEKLFERRQTQIVPDEKGIVICDVGIEYLAHTKEDYKSVLRHIFREEYKLIESIHDMSTAPSSRVYGSERGKCIDRVYIERFLEDHKNHIRGVCMEIGDDSYTRKYGESVDKSLVLHVYGEGEGTIKGNFETGEGIDEESVDCLICTQTLMAIYDLHNSISNIYRVLKTNGVALITVSGAGGTPISLGDYYRWGVYWRFTDMSLRRLLEESFDKDQIEIVSYGNVKTEMAFQYGLCAEDLSKEDFDYYDEKYPLIVAACVKKV